MGNFDWILEIVLVALLFVTLVHAIRLERALRTLRQDRAALGEAIAGFDDSTRVAEAGINRLNATAAESAQILAQRIEQSLSLKDDLQFLIDRGASVADRIDALVRANRVTATTAADLGQPGRAAARAESPQPSRTRVAPRAARRAMKQYLRPLPATIAVMMLVTGVKTAGLLHAVAIGSPARASTHGAPTEPKPTAEQSPKPAPQPERKAVMAEAAAPAEPQISEAERTALQDLRARRKQIEAQSARLDEREALLAAAERRLTERVTQLGTLQTKLEQLEKERRDRDESNWRGLVKTYETMRPRDAATIFNDLDSAVLIQVLDRMKEAKAAPIFAAMAPERARAVTAQLAQWRNQVAAAPRLDEAEQGRK